jgi:hypothetical protein
MAKRKNVKKTVAKESSPVVAAVKLEVRSDTPTYYVNYIGIAHTPYDFTLAVARIPAQLSSEQLEHARRGEPIPVDPILQLVVPPLVVDGLITALTAQREAFREMSEKGKQANDKQHSEKSNPVVN